MKITPKLEYLIFDELLDLKDKGFDVYVETIICIPNSKNISEVCCEVKIRKKQFLTLIDMENTPPKIKWLVSYEEVNKLRDDYKGTKTGKYINSIDECIKNQDNG